MDRSPPKPTHNAPRAVNLLFLIGLVLMLANAAVMWLPQYVRLSLNQLLFVFLPAYLYLRRTGLPLAERVRWRRPGLRITLLAFLIGAGLYPFSARIAALTHYLLGYSGIAAPDDIIPRSLGMGLFAVLAYAVLAPLCEEFLFRGVIQPVYERRSRALGVLLVGALFIVFHLSLLQGVSIVLLTLALGWVNARTRSLPASIATHVGANLPAALVLTQGLFIGGAEAFFLSMPALVGGLIVAAAAAVALHRLTRGEAPTDPGPTAAPHPLALRSSWPLLIAALLYLGMVTVEVITLSVPSPPMGPLTLEPAAWTREQRWAYELRNPADDVVGDGACTVTPQDGLVELICTSTAIPYEVTIGNSFWSSAGGTRTDRFLWRAADGRLLSGSTVMDLAEGDYYAEIDWNLTDEGIDVRARVRGEDEVNHYLPWGATPRGADPTLPVLTDYATPWQLAGLPLERGAGGQTLRLHPYAWRNEARDNGPVTSSFAVVVAGLEQIETPAGTFYARKVMFGNHQAVWYDPATTPPTPIRFFNGTETWSLQ